MAVKMTWVADGLAGPATIVGLADASFPRLVLRPTADRRVCAPEAVVRDRPARCPCWLEFVAGVGDDPEVVGSAAGDASGWLAVATTSVGEANSVRVAAEGSILHVGVGGASSQFIRRSISL